uniref:Uncharacterized protein n=1 Tax=Odontella aurita TaxID=265563 RepID=A0A7S4HTT4_9STRA
MWRAALRCPGAGAWSHVERKATAGDRSGCVHVASQFRETMRLWWRNVRRGWSACGRSNDGMASIGRPEQCGVTMGDFFASERPKPSTVCSAKANWVRWMETLPDEATCQSNQVPRNQAALPSQSTLSFSDKRQQKADSTSSDVLK